MSRYVPDRKILAAGLAGLAAWALILLAGALGIELPPDAAAAIVGGVMTLAGYLVPPAMADILRRIDDRMRASFAPPADPPAP